MAALQETVRDVRGPRSNAALIWRAFRRNRGAFVGGVIVLVSVLVALAAPWVAPYHPEIDAEPSLRLAPVLSPGHVLGMDGQGRDILSRLIYGSRISIAVGVLPVLLAAAISLVLGLTAGFYQGVLGQVIMRAMDILFAFPMVLLGVVLAGVLGPGFRNIVITLTIVFVPYLTRVIYTSTTDLREQEFVIAARASGARNWQIIVDQIIPNILSPVIVYCTTNIGLMIVFGSGLSFLGLGIQPPAAEWGVMTSDGRQYLAVAPHVATVPGIAILLVAIGFNLLGDGLRDALDPHLHGK